MANKISLHKCLLCGTEANAFQCPQCGADMKQYKAECPNCLKHGLSIAVWGKNRADVKGQAHTSKCRTCQYRIHDQHRKNSAPKPDGIVK